MQRQVQRFEFGDTVRHRKRPEWGVGTVTSVKDGPAGKGQTLGVRFPNAGMKTLNTMAAAIEPAEPSGNGAAAEGSPIDAWDESHRDGWLSGIAEQKIDEQMTSLPMESRDPFTSLKNRIAFTMALYRFDKSGKGLVDWAVAQTSLDDPLSRFTRQELEMKFDRWVSERDAHLSRLLHEARQERLPIDDLMGDAPTPVIDIVRRHINSR